MPRTKATLAFERALSGAVATLLLLSPASTAAAQERRWVVLSATARGVELARAVEVGEHSAGALAALGEIVLPSAQASARIEAQLSAPYHAAPDELVRRIGQVSEQVLEHVAFGRNQRALDRGEPLIAELDPHLAGLGRNEQAARDVANLCLYLVRAHWQKHDTGAARQQAQLCLRLVPDLDPDPQLHPPAVLELVAEHRARLDAGEGGILAIHSSPDDPSGCLIRVNGRAIGRSPMVRATLPPGTYLVQMECVRGHPGRLHSVVVPGEIPTRIVLHARLAQALETRPAVGLEYDSLERISENLAADIGALGSLFEANRALVVVHDGTSVSLRVFEISDGEAELTGSVPVPQPVAEETSRAAVRDVVEVRRRDGAARAAAEGSSTATIDAPATEASIASTSSDATGPIVLTVSGAVLAVTGGALVGVAVADVASVEDAEVGARWSTVSDAYERSKPLSIVGSVALGVGTAVAVGGLIWLAMPTEQQSSSVSIGVAPGLGAVAVRGSF